VQEPTVVAAWIQGGCAVLAAGIAAATGGLIGKRFSDRKKIEEKLSIAKNDILFLLKVEEEHCGVHANTSDKSLKNTVRRKAREKGFEWSGRFVPSSKWQNENLE